MLPVAQSAAAQWRYRCRLAWSLPTPRDWLAWFYAPRAWTPTHRHRHHRRVLCGCPTVTIDSMTCPKTKQRKCRNGKALKESITTPIPRGGDPARYSQKLQVHTGRQGPRQKVQGGGAPKMKPEYARLQGQQGLSDDIEKVHFSVRTETPCVPCDHVSQTAQGMTITASRHTPKCPTTSRDSGAVP